MLTSRSHLTISSVASLILFALASRSFAGGVLFVDDDAPPGGDGTTWDSAYGDLQEAIAQAMRGGVTEIRVAQGLYLPSDTPFDTKNPRFFTFLFVNGVELRGGYAGLGAPDPDARDIALFETVLSGDLGGNDGPGFQNYEENVSHVVSTDTAVDQTAILDGFTVTAGNADAFSGGAMGGGGLIVLSSPVIRKCTFRQNAAEEFGGALSFVLSNPMIVDCNFFENGESPSMQDPLRGGAIHVRDGMATISGCVFESNSADVGGALFTGWDTGRPTIELVDCTFSGNEGSTHGAIHFNNSTATVIDCTFQNHVAERTGAIFAKNSSIAVERCTFSNNHASKSGSTDGAGALTLSLSGAASILDCVFFQNSSENFGGAIHFNGSGPLTLERCVFVGNSSTWTGGGLLSWGPLSMTNCIFIANTAPQGAGIAVALSDQISITSSTFVANEATDSGGGISVGSPIHDGGDAELADSVLWGNMAAGKQDESAQIFVDVQATVTVDFSCIQGITGRFGGVGNIGDDPLFLQNPNPGPDGEWGTDDDEFGDLRLTPGSPCIDAADNTAPGLIGITVDLDGNPRFVDDPDTKDTGFGDPPIVDMGAYEFQATTTTTPDGFDAFRGFYVSGDLDSLLQSDDDELCYNPGIVLFQSEAPVTLDFTGTLPNDSPATLDVTIESSANTVGLELTISFWNYNTNSWDVVGTDTQTNNVDTVRTFAGTPADHVEAGTREVRTRYEVRVVSFIFLFPWLDCVDHVFWTTSN